MIQPHIIMYIAMCKNNFIPPASEALLNPRISGLHFSDTRYPQRENFHNKYRLDDAALDRIESIYHLQKSQVKNEPDLPTDMDIINALFQCEEFQSHVENIRTSYKVRALLPAYTPIPKRTRRSSWPLLMTNKKSSPRTARSQSSLRQRQTAIRISR